jgi:hypothetical protein
MNLGADFIPIFALSIGFIITITAILTDAISKYKLKKEQIKADAMVRAEEVRARNQLELEKIMRQGQGNDAYGTDYSSEPGQYYEEDPKRKSRVRE